MNNEEITKKLQELEARAIVNTIALNFLYRQAPPKVGQLLLARVRNTADYALSKAITDHQIELLLPLAHQIVKRS